MCSRVIYVMPVTSVNWKMCLINEDYLIPGVSIPANYFLLQTRQEYLQSFLKCFCDPPKIDLQPTGGFITVEKHYWVNIRLLPQVADWQTIFLIPFLPPLYPPRYIWKRWKKRWGQQKSASVLLYKMRFIPRIALTMQHKDNAISNGREQTLPLWLPSLLPSPKCRMQGRAPSVQLSQCWKVGWLSRGDTLAKQNPKDYLVISPNPVILAVWKLINVSR